MSRRDAHGVHEAQAPPIQTSDEREAARMHRVRKTLVTDPVLRGFGLAATIWLAAFAVATALVGDGSTGQKLLSDVVYALPVALAAGLSALAAHRARGRQRRFWTLLAVSNALWLGGELVWGFYELVLAQETPFPSFADALYISSYALVVPAVIVGFAGSGGLRIGRALLDASIMVVALGYAGWVLLIGPQLSYGASLATATGIAYPLLGVAILMTIIAVAFSSHRQVPRSIVLVGIAFAISAVTDAGYTYLSVLHEYVPGSWLDMGWQLEAVLLSLAALVVLRHDEGEGERQRFDRDLGLPAVLLGTAGTVGIVALDAADGGLRVGSAMIAVFAVVGVVLRLFLTSRDKDQIARALERSLAAQERLAITDGLTLLHNRRFFEEMLKLESERATRHGRELGLVVFDLDHFKEVNDRYGHQAGDRVLSEAAARLSAASRSSDLIARYGGEEFVLLLPESDREEVLEIAERCRLAIAQRPFILIDGRQISLTTSAGAATLPAEAATPVDLMRAADNALYVAKHLGRDRVQLGAANGEQPTGTDDVGTGGVLAFLQKLADETDARQGTVEHSAAMVAWAGELADAFELDAHQRERCVLGTRFHDVGKLAVPDSILKKPGPLSEAEWDVVRQHCDRGAGIVALVPGWHDVAEVVRDHHERWDGTGYPNRKSGTEIPLEARIVAVCDAWAAMLADRPYRRRIEPSAAAAQLRAGSGSQFDPDVVEAFLALSSSGSFEPTTGPLLRQSAAD